MKACLRICLAVMILILSILMPVATTPPAIQAAGPWYVVPLGNDVNNCLSPTTACATINGAIGKASAGDTIYVAAGTYTGSGDNVVEVGKNLTLSGGWDSAFAQQGDMSTIDGQAARRVISNTAVTTIDRFILQGGVAPTSSLPYDGGGLLNWGGVLTLNHSVVMSNTAPGIGSGGGIDNYYASLYINDSIVISNTANGGGGILNSGVLSLNNSVVSNNTGGGIMASGSQTINNCSITQNQGGYGGGGIAIGGSLGDTAIINSTIVSNTADFGGGIYIDGYRPVTIRSTTITGNSATVVSGGGIYNHGNEQVTVKNTILAKNTDNGGFGYNKSISSLGYNLIDAASANVSVTATDLVSEDPLLGPLTGLPGYCPLLLGSPAINAGDPAGCTDGQGNPLSTDQRGLPRAGRCDIGAYELQSIFLPVCFRK